MSQTSSWDPEWEKIFRENEWGKYPPEHVIRFIARQFFKAPDRRQIKVLDLGCGTGACTWFIAREGMSVAGIDGSQTAVDRAAKRLAAEGLSADLKVGDYVQLPWADGTFDAVIDNASLGCNRFEDCQRVVAEVLRVLKPGGKFQSSNFSPNTWGYGMGTEVEKNGYRDIPDGPLGGRGFVLFMDEQQHDALFAPFVERATEKASWTVDHMRHLIELWIIECRKPQT